MDRHTTTPLWEAIEREPDKLASMAANTSANNLAGFFHYAPLSLAKVVLGGLPADHWEKVASWQTLNGLTQVAARCADVERDDLKSAIIITLLRRANPQDFPPARGQSLANLAWLINNAPSGSSGLIPTFLDALCTKNWLGRQFTVTACGHLAKGLRLLAFQQPPSILRRFENPSLGIRLRKEFAQFAGRPAEEQSQIVQLLGCAALWGYSVESSWLKNVPHCTIATLPQDILPHRADAKTVEGSQFQLWLGLRAVTAVSGRAIAVPQALILRTLDLWRLNLAESSVDMASR